MFSFFAFRINSKFLTPKNGRFISKELTNKEDEKWIEKILNTREDVASYVRFNRKWPMLSFEQFPELYASETNPGKTPYELEEIRLRLEMICREYELLSRENCRVPAMISVPVLAKMLQMPSAQHRQRFLLKTYFRETIKVRTKIKKQIKKLLKPPSRPPEELLRLFDPDDGQLQYGLWRNSLFSRFYGKNRRLWIQSAINTKLWGVTLAFDWHLPSGGLNHRDEDVFAQQIKQLALKIFKIDNHNLKVSGVHQPGFNVVHLNISQENPFFQPLTKIYRSSPLDYKFFDPQEQSVQDLFSNEEPIYYVNPFAEKCLQLDQDDLNQAKAFVFSPLTEMFGLSRPFLMEMFRQKEAQSSQNVRHRRLPIHDMVRQNKHLVLAFQIQCLRDVLFDPQTIDWTKALYKNVPSKYYLHR